MHCKVFAHLDPHMNQVQAKRDAPQELETKDLC